MLASRAPPRATLRGVRAAVIEELAVRALSVPTRDPFVIASGAVTATRSVLVEVAVARAGRVERGLGEGACLPPVTKEDQPDALRAVQRCRGALLGLRVDSPGELAAALDAALPERTARAAVEVAVLDALARHDGQPLAWWLAGSAGGAASLETDITIPILPLERMAELARQWWAQGFRALKVKVGRDLDADLRALEALHRAVPGARFRPDANAGLDAAQALAYAAAARTLGATLECFEQPCASLEAMAEVAARLDLPVLADESVATLADAQRVVAARAADGLNLKIAKSGSLLRAREIGLFAQARGMPLMVGGMVETRLGMTAATHLAASLGGVAFADLDTAWLLTSDPFVGGYQERGPIYRLGAGAGLGIALR